MVLTANATIVHIRLTPGGVDEYGDPIPSSETLTTKTDWGVAPRASADITDPGRFGVTVGLDLYMPFDADFVREDLVEVNGERYDVDGEVAEWKSLLSGWEAGKVVALKRAAG